MVQDIPLDIKVAVMGCVVNGPGEAKEADIGIAGGVGVGLLIKHGPNRRHASASAATAKPWAHTISALLCGAG